MEHKTILVVDDDPVERKALLSKLGTSGYQVLLAEDRASVISTARRERPDLILLDTCSPPDAAHDGGVPWDGFLILSWLRRLEETRETPVVFISGCDPLKFRSHALSAGAVDFLRKPFQAAELLAAVNRGLQAAKPSPPGAKKILFVDDEGDWRLVAGACLADAGFEVLTAKDSAEVLQRMEHVKIEGVVLDVKLAGENGLLLLGLLKHKDPGVPVLIYTGLDHDSAAIADMLKQGATRYLRKGSMADLCATLKSMVS